MATILVIDDRPSNRHYLVTLLGYSGHRLLEASNGMEGLTVMQLEQPDLVITDILMPTMDGFEFVRHLRTDPVIAGIPVIFFSATYHPHEVRDLAQACGVTHILAKPAEPSVILGTVHAALGLTGLPAAPLRQQEFDHEHVRRLSDTLRRQDTTLENTVRRLRTWLDFGQELAAERTMPQLLKRVCHVAPEVIGAQYTVLAMLEEHGQALSQVMTSGLDPEGIVPHTALASLQGLLALLHTQRGARRLQALSGDPQVVGLPSHYPPVYAFLTAPLITSGPVYGWLCLINKVGAEAFSAEDEQYAITLAMQTALAYENAWRCNVSQQQASQLTQEVIRRQRAEAELRQLKATGAHRQGTVLSKGKRPTGLD